MYPSDKGKFWLQPRPILWCNTVVKRNGLAYKKSEIHTHSSSQLLLCCLSVCLHFDLGKQNSNALFLSWASYKVTTRNCDNLLKYYDLRKPWSVPVSRFKAAMACNLTDEKYKRLANQFFGGLEFDKELPTVTLSRELEKPQCNKEVN